MSYPPIWINNLLGMNQRQDKDKIPDNYAPFLLNISHDKPGTWGKRKGTTILGETLAGNGVDGLVDYVKNDSTHVLRVMRGTDMSVYDAVNDEWDASILGSFNDTRIESVNFLNRVYSVGLSRTLGYENGGGTFTVVGTGSPNNTIKGSSIAVAQNTLFIGGVTEIGGVSQSYQDRVYYSLFDNDANSPSDQLFEDDETITTSSRWFSVGAPVKALYTNSAIGLVCVFTEEKCYTFDIRFAENAAGVNLLFAYGCANQRSITECNGRMVWMNSEKKILKWGGADGAPVELSWDIQDGKYDQALINLISVDELATICAGSINNEFFFSVGDITYEGVTYENCVLRGFTTQAFDYVLWSLYTYPYKPQIFANTVILNQKQLVMGCDDNDVYLVNSSTNDNGDTINALFRTKFYDLGKPIDTKLIKRVFIKYRPQPVVATYLSLKYAIDGDYTYQELSTPDDGSPVTVHGVIDMSKRYSLTKLDDVDYVEVPQQAIFRLFSLEGSNNKLDETFEVSAIGIQVNEIKGIDQRLQ